jgi:hypothetical protein
MSINKDDLRLVSNLGQSLWAQPEQSRAITRETVSAASVVSGQPDRALEASLQALLDRANKKGMYSRVPTGFNALFPEERFILLALHQGRWSYARVARVVRESEEMVQQLAWNARVYLALTHYPSAPVQAGSSCPEYDPQRPWTQKLLDEEVRGQEKLFLQGHLSRCNECRQALLRAKEVYYGVQKKIDALEASAPLPGLTAQLHTLLEQGRQVKSASGTGRISDGLREMLARADVRLLLLGWVVGLFFYFRH